MSKYCTPLRREADLEVKMPKVMLGALLEAEVSKKCAPLWRKVKSVDAEGPRPVLEVELLQKRTALCGEAHFFEVKSVER